MKHYSVCIFCLILFALPGAGCKKFLSVRPDSNANFTPRNTQDFEQILNNSALAAPNFLVADLMSDDIMLSDTLTTYAPSAYYTLAYNWASTVWGPADDDYMYNNSYQMILQMNVVVDNISASDSGTVKRKNIALSQAKINRAYYYFQLVNLYGKGYQLSSAATDLGVPIVLHPGNTLLGSRATVQAVYNQILLDLEDGVNDTDLPNFGIDIIHPGKAAALAMEARVYLFMGNYDQALAKANAALNLRSTILDYNTFRFAYQPIPSYGIYNKPFKLQDETANPEVLFAKFCSDDAFYNKYSTTPFISDSLAALYGSVDLRYVFNFFPGTGIRYTYFLYSHNSMQFEYNIGVPEMMLIKAECLLRNANADVNGALSLLNQLRKCRFSPSDYNPLTGTDASAVLKMVLDERRRELFLHGGMRLFDLKRLNTDSRFKIDIQRISDVTGKVIATLPAGSPLYVLPLAPKVIAGTPAIIQNIR